MISKHRYSPPMGLYTPGASATIHPSPDFCWVHRVSYLPSRRRAAFFFCSFVENRRVHRSVRSSASPEAAAAPPKSPEPASSTAVSRAHNALLPLMPLSFLSDTYAPSSRFARALLFIIPRRPFAHKPAGAKPLKKIPRFSLFFPARSGILCSGICSRFPELNNEGGFV